MKKMYAIVHHVTQEILNIVECGEHEINHVLVGLHLKMELPEGLGVGDIVSAEPPTPPVPDDESPATPVHADESPAAVTDEHAD